MPLANIEKQFIEHLLKPGFNETEFLSGLVPVGLLSEEKQLSIYRSNINGAHEKVLARIYPACRNVLGEDYFNQLCREYRYEYPSIDHDLNNYGEYFSLFINQKIEFLPELSEFEYLAELAWLEWNWHSSYFSQNDELFDFDKLALVTEEKYDNLVFLLSHSFSLHSTLYPLLEIWNANKNEIEEEQVFYLPDEEVCFCIMRVDFAPMVKVLDKNQYTLLKSISDSATLSQLHKFYTENNEIDVDDFQNKLISFIEQGWLTGFLYTA